MSGGYLALLKKKVPLNNLLHNLRTPLFVGKKEIPNITMLKKNYEKEYNEYKRSNRLSYEDFQKINWRR